MLGLLILGISSLSTIKRETFPAYDPPYIMAAIVYPGASPHPLAVALFSSRRKRDLFWVACAVAGILLLLPDMKGQDSLDPVGVVLALAAGACWADFTLSLYCARMD